MYLNEELIELVRKYPFLYDVEHEEYKNNRKKDKVWQDIGDQLEMKGVQVKKRWKNLRNAYVKYLKSATTTGQLGTKIKKYQWADHMQYLRPFLASNLNLSFENVAISDDFEVSQNNFENTNGEVKLEFELNSPDEETSIFLPSSPTSSITTSRKRKISNSENDSTTNSLNKYDATDLLFLAHAKTVKTFSGTRQAITKMKIAQVLMDEEIEHQKELISSQETHNSLNLPQSTQR